METSHRNRLLAERTRRPVALVALLPWVLSAAMVSGGAEVERPHIVLILADDLGYADLSSYGSPACRTPQIDRLAGEGMLFTDAYTAVAVCSPTRAALLTGQYPARLRITDWIPGHDRPWEKLAIPDWRRGLNPGEPTIATILATQGYASAMFGKWHVSRTTAPDDVGFDLGVDDWTRNRADNPDDPKGVFSLTQETLDFIAAHKNQPVFVLLSHFAPHGPLRYHPDVRRRYEEELGPDSPIRPAYAAMIEALDDSVGMLMRGLDTMGVLDNTLVIFYSDNGGQLGPTTNAPLRSGKGHPYEGGLRVPLIAWWPGKIPAGTVSSEIVTSVDFLPTLADVAGVDSLPPDRDGLSFLRVLTDQAPMEREAVYWHYPHYHQGPPFGAIRKGDYKLIEFFEAEEVELYNLSEDLSETTDISQHMPEKASELLADLQHWRDSVNAQMMGPNPDYDPARAGTRR